MPNILNTVERKLLLDEIRGDENRRRKNDSLKRYDIYQRRQHQYLREQLLREYSARTVQEMRVVSSINLGRRIIDEKASLYTKPPTRTYTRQSEKPLTDQEKKQIEALHKYARTDEAMKKANRYYKLQSQCAIQVIPKNGVISMRVLQPHNYDVIPKDNDPESAEAYIISVYDKSLLYNTSFQNLPAGSQYLSQTGSDNIDQSIADSDDYKKRAGERFIWWSEHLNFLTDGWGNLIDELGRRLYFSTAEEMVRMLENPIHMLPFVDVATEKEFEYWVRLGNDAIDFALDFSVLLSDTAEINKRQGYSQAIIYSEEPPTDKMIGPHRILHMKINPDSETQPKFEWATPSPDMQSALQMLQTFLSLYLTSEGMDPKTISTQVTGQDFASGIERLLSMIEKFEASQDDAALFQHVEMAALRIMVAWSNLLKGATIQGGIVPLRQELQISALPDDLECSTLYQKPEALQTQAEAEDSVIKRMENGLMSRKQALMKLDGLTEIEADEKIKMIDADMQMSESTDRDEPPAAEEEANGEYSEGQIQN